MYHVPTLEEGEDFLAALFKALFPDRNVGSKRSYHRRRVKIIAAAVTELHAHMLSAADDVMPDRATIASGTLVRWGDIFGVERKSATPARKASALRVRGDVGSPVTIGEAMTHEASGQTFEIGESFVIPADGFYDSDVVATSSGSATRLSAGETLSFDTTPAGIETNAELQLDLDEDGYDQEPEGAYRRRILQTIGTPQSGGNDSDHVRWALEVDGVDQAYPYSNRAGIGSVDIVGLHNGTGVRSLTSTERGELLAYVAAKEPSQVGGDGGSLRVLTTVEDEQDVDVQIETDDGMDFDDGGTGLTVLSVDAPNRKVTLNADRPASMLAGHLVCFHGVATSQTGEHFVIESLDGTAAFILEEWPDTSPAATDKVFAGSDAAVIVRSALVSHLAGETLYADDGAPISESVADEQGLTVELNELARGIGPANPDGLYGDWSGDIVRAVLIKIATYVRGVRNADVVTPATDYVAQDYAFPLDHQVGLVTAGEVLVRGAA